MSTQTAAPRTDGARSTLNRVLGGSAGRSLGLVIALLVLFAVGTITAGDRFASWENILTIVRFASIIGVISIGMTFVITAGGIDLSVGSVMGLATVVATLSWVQQFASSTNWIVMVVVALAVGGAAGLINGIVIAYGNVVAFMATLAMLVAARGLAEVLANRTTQIVIEPGFLSAMRGEFIGVPVLIWIFVLVVAAGWFLLNRTTFGRRTVAIGGNLEAARLAGIKVKRHLMYVYILSGLTAGIAAVMMLARTTAGTSTHGTLYELDAIAAVVVGGTLLIGGRGTIMGTVLGVLIFSTLTNVFTQNNLSTSVQAIAKGVIIVIAVMLQQRFANRAKR
ncbi:ABC transporter permease [Herbiconiux sp. KACC 21604]|uniref:ABC transporter permease n=1 Tax=unclassified Herbiconiux TaxID=2618217 RepID=UPI001491F8BE|nr:ABC transporter permease [Herbiconiux sp. SALV-R1]QJU54864.1 ABC transporter permease [Herbiconiux sp. SALV-R1]WPO85986.1 ABC transporter permease [Herbiconiux sp. KACC 21604]